MVLQIQQIPDAQEPALMEVQSWLRVVQKSVSITPKLLLLDLVVVIAQVENPLLLKAANYPKLNNARIILFPPQLDVLKKLKQNSAMMVVSLILKESVLKNKSLMHLKKVLNNVQVMLSLIKMENVL